MDRTDPWHTFTEVLAVMPDVVDRLLTDHVPDPDSGRCRACTVGGTGLPGKPWPCSVHALAAAALVASVRRAQGGRQP